VDLSILTTALLPPALLKESKEIWEWESVFSEIAQSMQTEKEHREEHQAKEPDEEDESNNIGRSLGLSEKTSQGQSMDTSELVSYSNKRESNFGRDRRRR
jgi:hypothetical protein